jgi:aerobic-type carbon monoxide dehydrogenase small subunit (CoxS/CutS family)
MVYTLNLNGSERRVDAPAGEPLLHVLRDRLDLTGAKYGCGEGHCGACTVIINGAATRSCQVPIESVGTQRIRTVEGLAAGDRLHAVQQAFLEEDALQCGYCTPGMIMAAVALLESTPSPSAAEIARTMQRNICRCGAYPRIIAAVQRAAAARTTTVQRERAR